MDPKLVIQRFSSAPRILRRSHRSSCSRKITQCSQSTTRSFSNTSHQSTVYLSPQEELTSDPTLSPRWRQTPKDMKMPFQVRRPAKQEAFYVNESPTKLNKVYDKILGRDGWRTLTEETRWLAVTHKSFDQGRRGFNARLSYIGMLNRN